MATPREVGEWMAAKVLDDDYLYQEQVVYEIAEKFGDEHVYQNQNGNLAISKSVLKEFGKITEGSVVWERGGRFWRKRQPNDDPNKRQVN